MQTFETQNVVVTILLSFGVGCQFDPKVGRENDDMFRSYFFRGLTPHHDCELAATLRRVPVSTLCVASYQRALTHSLTGCEEGVLPSSAYNSMIKNFPRQFVHESTTTPTHTYHQEVIVSRVWARTHTNAHTRSVRKRRHTHPNTFQEAEKKCKGIRDPNGFFW